MMCREGRRIYLDHAAGAPLLEAAREAWLEAAREIGNPSSVHGFGRAARRLLEEAREALACRLGVHPARIVWTSGGTEANNLALAQAGDRPALVSAIEHPSVLEAAPGAVRIPVTAAGIVDLDALERLLATLRPALVSVMWANNETGILQPIAEVAERCRRFGARLHVDAVQAAAGHPLAIDALGIAYLSLSAHKIGGPPGIGLLVVPEGEVLVPLLRGGGQERGRRAGTENVAAACAFRAALEAADAAQARRLAALRDELESRLLARCPEAVVVGRTAPRVPHISCIAYPGAPAELQVMALDLEGIAVSAGSACSSGKVRRSPVLEAMGLAPEIAGCAIRVSLGPGTDRDQLEAFLEAWLRCVPPLAREAVPLAETQLRTT